MKNLRLLALSFSLSLNFVSYGKESAPTLKDPKEIVNIQLSELDYLMEMTELSLKQMHILRQDVYNYKQIQELYLEKIEDKELLYRMLKTADDLLKKIQADSLTSMFDADFIKELKTLSSIYKKMGLPKP